MTLFKSPNRRSGEMKSEITDGYAVTFAVCLHRPWLPCHSDKIVTFASHKYTSLKSSWMHFN